MTTLIGYGSPNKAGTHDVHGAALGDPETEETRSNLGWKYPPFELPDGVLDNFSRVEEVRALPAAATPCAAAAPGAKNKCGMIAFGAGRGSVLGSACRWRLYLLCAVLL